MNTEEWNGVSEHLFAKYGVYGSLYTRKLEAAIMRTKDFMLRLLGSGIEPASVSLEGFKYVCEHILVHDVKLPHDSMRWDLAGVLIEEATKRAGIHSDQLRARREQKG